MLDLAGTSHHLHHSLCLLADTLFNQCTFWMVLSACPIVDSIREIWNPLNWGPLNERLSVIVASTTIGVGNIPLHLWAATFTCCVDMFLSEGTASVNLFHCLETWGEGPLVLTGVWPQHLNLLRTGQHHSCVSRSASQGEPKPCQMWHFFLPGLCWTPLMQWPTAFEAARDRDYYHLDFIFGKVYLSSRPPLLYEV